MSFSSDLKEELGKMSNLKDKELVKYELIGYLISSNTQVEKNKIKFVTESDYNINRFGKLLSNLNIRDYKIEVVGKKYIITTKKIELDEIIYTPSIDIKDLIIKDELYIKAILRGAFLGSGYMNNPEKTYHIEFSFSSLNNLEFIEKILLDYKLNIKRLERNKDLCIYLKEGEDISELLAIIGANEGVIRFEEIRVLRDMKNQINRMVNCETSNLNKTINAAISQIEDIKLLKKTGELKKLSPEVIETAEVRLQNPEMSLTEIGEKLSIKTGKSGVNYRLKKIKERAEEIRNGK